MSRRRFGHILARGCTGCGAAWDLNAELRREGVAFPAAFEVFQLGMRRVRRRLEREHGGCALTSGPSLDVTGEGCER
jgi:hypothetical protein